jgi:hypothetical protein
MNAQTVEKVRCKSNIGWLLFRHRLESEGALSGDWVESAADRQSPSEAAAGAWVVGVWTFLGVGVELHGVIANGGWWLVGWLAWPLLWMLVLQALVLLPAMLLLPIIRGFQGSDAQLARAMELGAITLLTVWALRMTLETSLWGSLLGGFWIVGLISEVLIGAFRRMLLASRA